MFARLILIIGIMTSVAYGAAALATRSYTPTAVDVRNVLASVTPPPVPMFTIGWVGDIVPGVNASYNTHVLDGVAQYTTLPTLMMGNLEGTFAHEDRYGKCGAESTQCYAFRGDPALAQSLVDAGFDFVSLINNHSYDYGEDGLADTEAVLIEHGITYISPSKPTAQFVKNGVRIGVAGVSSTPPAQTITDYAYIERTVAKLKETNDIVILVFHGGAEGSDKTTIPGTYEYQGDENRGDVQAVAEHAIDAGADIVLGSGPHVLRPVVYYKGKPIIYSAGNFVGGDSRLVTTGTLGISGIFTIDTTKHPMPFSVTSVSLSRDGTPSIDSLDRGAAFIHAQ